jgi:DNA modification methylase
MIDLRQGDCLELMKDIPDKSIDLVVTDPPYLQVKGGCKSKIFNVGIREKSSKVVSQMSDFGEYQIYKFLDTVKPKMKVFNAYIFCSRLQVPYYLEWALKNKMNFDILIWDKMNHGLISRTHFAPNIEYIIRINKKGLNKLENKTSYYQKIKKYKRPQNKIHEAEKPIDLLKEFIELSSKENDTILDCFMGSGTTGVACKELNRSFIGIELDEKYFEIAKNRIEGV